MVTFLGCPWGLPGSGAFPGSLPSLGLTQRSLATGNSGSFLQAFPPTSLILPSQNQVVLLITIHCPLQSASPRMSVHQSVNKHHRKRFHHRRTWCMEKQSTTEPSLGDSRRFWAFKALRSAAAKITKSQNTVLLYLFPIQCCSVSLHKDSSPSHPKLASSSQPRNTYCRTCFMPCSTMRAGIVIMEEMDTALTLRDRTFIRGITCVFNYSCFLGSDGKFQGGDPASLSMDTSSDSALALRDRALLLKGKHFRGPFCC